MPDEQTDTLSRIFSEYRTRTAQSPHAAPFIAGATEWRHPCQEVLRDKVLPVLEEIADRSREEGHRADVVQHLSGYLYPSLYLTFAPHLPSAGSKHATPSRITFRCGPANHIELRMEIFYPSRRVVSAESSGPNLEQLGSLDRDWVEEQVLPFIEEVLQAT